MSSFSSVPDINVVAPVIVFLTLSRSALWSILTYSSVPFSIANAASHLTVRFLWWGLPHS